MNFNCQSRHTSGTDKREMECYLRKNNEPVSEQDSWPDDGVYQNEDIMLIVTREFLLQLVLGGKSLKIMKKQQH